MRIAFVTSTLTAFCLALALKGLSFFQMVKWKPISFIKKSYLFEGSATFIHWSVLIFILFVMATLLYVLTQYLYFMPAWFLSLTLGLILAVLIEWKIYNLPSELISFKKLSIPFIVIVIGFTHFIIETAIFHKKARNLESRNKLPYKSGVIK